MAMAALAASLAGSKCSLPSSRTMYRNVPASTEQTPLEACRTSALADCRSLRRKERTCPVVARALAVSTAQRPSEISTHSRVAISPVFEHNEATSEWQKQEKRIFHHQKEVPLPFSGPEGKEGVLGIESANPLQRAKLGRLQKFLRPEPEKWEGDEYASMPFTIPRKHQKNQGQELEGEGNASRPQKNQTWSRGQSQGDYKGLLDVRVHKASVRGEVAERKGQHSNSSTERRQVRERNVVTSIKPTLSFEGVDPIRGEDTERTTETDSARNLSESDTARKSRSIEASDKSGGDRPGHKLAPIGNEKAAAQTFQGSFRKGPPAGARQAFSQAKSAHNRQSVEPTKLEKTDSFELPNSTALDPLLTILEHVQDLSSGTPEGQRKFEAQYSLRRRQQKALSAALEDEVLLHQPWEVEQPNFPAEPPIGLELFYKGRTEPSEAQTVRFQPRKEKRGGPWQPSKRRQYYRRKRLEQSGLSEINEDERERLVSELETRAEEAENFLFPPLPRPIPHEIIKRRKLRPEPSQKFIAVPPKQRNVLSLREAVSWSRGVRSR